MEKSKIDRCKVLLIGGSAGSLDVLMRLLPEITTISYAMVIIVHRKNAEDSTLEELIAHKSHITVQEVEDKTPLQAGFIYIAPSDYHLLFEADGLLSLDVSEKVNYSRPSIDVAFESAADVYHTSLTAILLSGSNSDGTNGLLAVKNNGGTTVVQQPQSADMPYMPQSAIDMVKPDYILDIAQLIAFVREINR